MTDKLISRLAGLNVIVRVDHNAPSTNGGILDDTRLLSSLPALVNICGVARRVVILSHRGDPPGHDNAFSLRPFFERIAERLPGAVFCPDAAPDELRRNFLKYRNATVFYGENVRFLPQEKRNDPALAQAWAQCGDVFVLDAFSVVHRNHASVAGIPKFLPAFAGPSLEAERARIDAIAETALKVGIVIGGAKLATKLSLARRLSGRVEKLCLVGLTGYVAATRERLDFEEAAILPSDLILRDSKSRLRVGPVTEEPSEEWASHDTGPETLRQCIVELQHCDTIVWNGPFGVYESQDGRSMTRAFCSWLAGQRERRRMRLIVGGGDTLAALKLLGYSDVPSVDVTAGGALLAYWAEKQNLPGLRALVQSRTSAAS